MLVTHGNGKANLPAWPAAIRPDTAQSAEMVTLRSAASGRGFQIGAAVALDPLRLEPIYRATLKREFNLLVPENAMKFGDLRPSPDRYDFAGADSIVAFARSSGMKIRGHTLIWPDDEPGWLFDPSTTRSELAEILRKYIATVVGRYRGKVAAWDVVNEAVQEDGQLRSSVWLRALGPRYIDLAFRWAHEADPGALLFYNDGGGEGMGRKSDAVYHLVHGLRRRGVPIDGVGLQMHVEARRPPDIRGIAANLNRLAGLGLEIQITEMDVRLWGKPTEDKLRKQARIYGEILKTCLSVPRCTALIFWGFTDRHSWIPKFFPGYDSALIFDRFYRPKPAYYALLDVLTGR